MQAHLRVDIGDRELILGAVFLPRDQRDARERRASVEVPHAHVEITRVDQVRAQDVHPPVGFYI